LQRRRRWSQAEKERICAAAMEPGAVASEVARAAGIHTSQLFRWRQVLCERTQFPAVIQFGGGHSRACGGFADLAREGWRYRDRVASGGWMRISGSVDASTVLALMKALAQGKRRR